jgi:hypothetical protein
MMPDANNLGHAGRRGRRLRLAGPVALALLIMVLLAAACAEGPTGPGVAGEGASSSPSASPSGDRRDALLAYSQCMRDHGISDFPDPEPGGGIAVQAVPGSDLDPNNPQYKAADEACRSLLPPPPTEEQQEQERAEALKYSKCMRAHGISDFPDPNAEGGIDLNAEPGSDLDPNNPQFQAADKACGGSGADTDSSGGSAP